jgi:hypothetical protein
MALTAKQLSSLSPESETAFRQRFIEDPVSHEIRFTPKGFAEYGARFAKAGIDINQIRNRGQMRDAVVRSEWVFIEELREMVKGHKEIEDAINLHYPVTQD